MTPKKKKIVTEKQTLQTKLNNVIRHPLQTTQYNRTLTLESQMATRLSAIHSVNIDYLC